MPFLPTATAAAAFAIRNAVSQSAPAESVTASTAATVSPAPETSRTLTGCAGTWIASPWRGTSVMPCSLCVTRMASQSASCIASLRRVRNALFGVGAAAGRFGKFLAVRRQQRGAAIDREIGALGIDDHALAEFARGIDDVADHPRGQHALGIVGQQHDVRARQLRQDGVDQLLLDLAGRRLRHFPIRAQHVGGEMFGNEAHLSRRRPRRIGNQHALDSGFLRQRGFQRRAGIVLTDQPDKNAARAERGDVARDVAGAADIGFAAPHGNDRRGRFRRNPRDLAIDEFVEHEIADAEHRLAGNRIRQGFKIEHLNSSPVAPSAETVGGIEKSADVGRDGIFQRR